MAKISYDKVQDYLTSLVPPREPELQAMEEYAEKNNFPIIGPACGYYCYQLVGLRLFYSLVRQSSDGKWWWGGASYRLG